MKKIKSVYKEDLITEAFKPSTKNLVGFTGMLQEVFNNYDEGDKKSLSYIVELIHNTIKNYISDTAEESEEAAKATAKSANQFIKKLSERLNILSY